MSDDVDWPVRLTLRDTKVISDEGQRIFTTSIGHGYQKREYVRADTREALVLCIKALEAKLKEADALIEAQQADFASNNIRCAEYAHRIKTLEASLSELKGQTKLVDGRPESQTETA